MIFTTLQVYYRIAIYKLAGQRQRQITKNSSEINKKNWWTVSEQSINDNYSCGWQLKV